MTVEIKMPALSPTMEKGSLATWLVEEGDLIKTGDLLAEIETDKATMELEAAQEGRIAHLLIPAGTDDVAVGTVIALLTAAGEDAPAVRETAPATAAAMAAPRVLLASPPTPAPASIGALEPDEQADATPLARRLAAAHDIDLSRIAGSGQSGRILRADLGLTLPARLMPTAEADAPPRASSVAPPPSDVPVSTIQLGRMRKTIARRLTESKTQIPHFYLTARCRLDSLLTLREELNRALADRGVKLSVNDMLIKALALALIEVPDAHVQFGGDVLHRFGRVDVSMAVAVEDGLVTPVLQDVGALSLSAIANASKALASRAREGRLAPVEYEGGTVSLSNLGMFGIDEIFPVINPPQALILGVAAGIRQPWSINGEQALATVMAVTASFDHRAIDGATGAAFMAALRKLIEAPMLLLG